MCLAFVFIYKKKILLQIEFVLYEMLIFQTMVSYQVQ